MFIPVASRLELNMLDNFRFTDMNSRMLVKRKMNKKQSEIRTESWKTSSDVGGCSRWTITAYFIPKGTQILKSKFNKAEYDKFHKGSLEYEKALY